MNINQFLDTVFRNYVSIQSETFNLRCSELNKNPEDAKEFLIQNGFIREIANGHLEFLRYE